MTVIFYGYGVISKSSPNGEAELRSVNGIIILFITKSSHSRMSSKTNGN